MSNVKMPHPEIESYINCANGQKLQIFTFSSEQMEQYASAVRDEALARQATVAYRAIDNAKALASTLHSEAQRLNAESNPDSLASEREANKILTAEVEKLQDDLKRARPTYFSDGYQAGWNSATDKAADLVGGSSMTSRHAAAAIRALKDKGESDGSR